MLIDGLSINLLFKFKTLGLIKVNNRLLMEFKLKLNLVDLKNGLSPFRFVHRHLSYFVGFERFLAS